MRCFISLSLGLLAAVSALSRPAGAVTYSLFDTSGATSIATGPRPPIFVNCIDLWKVLAGRVYALEGLCVSPPNPTWIDWQFPGVAAFVQPSSNGWAYVIDENNEIWRYDSNFQRWAHLGTGGGVDCLMSMSSNGFGISCDNPRPGQTDYPIYQFIGGSWTPAGGGAAVQVAGANYVQGNELFAVTSDSRIWKYAFASKTWSQTSGLARHIEATSDGQRRGEVKVLGTGVGFNNVYQWSPANNAWNFYASTPPGVTFVSLSREYALDSVHRIWRSQ